MPGCPVAVARFNRASTDSRPLGLFVPALLIAGKTGKMKVFEATISALACGLDVIPCGQVIDPLKLAALAILVMQPGKYHSRSANTALPALKLKGASLASVFVLREFAQTITVLLQCLVAVSKSAIRAAVNSPKRRSPPRRTGPR